MPAGLERSMDPTATPLTDGALEFVTHGGPHDYANGVEWRMGATSAGRHFNAGASPPGLILTSPNHVWQPPSKRKSLGITWLGEKTWREGRYTLRSNIGTGRFGSVWSATRISSGPTRTFAIKLSNEAEVSISMGDEVVGSACKHYEKAPGTGVKVKKNQLAAFPAGWPATLNPTGQAAASAFFREIGFQNRANELNLAPPILDYFFVPHAPVEQMNLATMEPEPVDVLGSVIVMGIVAHAVDMETYMADPSFDAATKLGIIDMVVSKLRLLNRHGILHGDAHLGNVLVWDGDAVLLDFGKSRRCSVELGTCTYEHTGSRDHEHFCEKARQNAEARALADPLLLRDVTRYCEQLSSDVDEAQMGSGISDETLRRLGEFHAPQRPKRDGTKATSGISAETLRRLGAYNAPRQKPGDGDSQRDRAVSLTEAHLSQL